MKTEIVTLIACCLLVASLLALFWGGALLERRLNRSIREHFDPSVRCVSRFGLWVGGRPPHNGWTWHVFGRTDSDSLVSVHITWPVPLWRRVVTRILLGSVWERRK